jgi:hypothetical protein
MEQKQNTADDKSKLLKSEAIHSDHLANNEEKTSDGLKRCDKCNRVFESEDSKKKKKKRAKKVVNFNKIMNVYFVLKSKIQNFNFNLFYLICFVVFSY